MVNFLIVGSRPDVQSHSISSATVLHTCLLTVISWFKQYLLDQPNTCTVIRVQYYHRLLITFLVDHAMHIIMSFCTCKQFCCGKYFSFLIEHVTSSTKWLNKRLLLHCVKGFLGKHSIWLWKGLWSCWWRLIGVCGTVWELMAVNGAVGQRLCHKWAKRETEQISEKGN